MNTTEFSALKNLNASLTYSPDHRTRSTIPPSSRERSQIAHYEATARERGQLAATLSHIAHHIAGTEAK